MSTSGTTRGGATFQTRDALLAQAVMDLDYLGFTDIGTMREVRDWAQRMFHNSQSPSCRTLDVRAPVGEFDLRDTTL